MAGGKIDFRAGSELLADLDAYAHEGGYGTRSAALRVLVREALDAWNRLPDKDKRVRAALLEEARAAATGQVLEAVRHALANLPADPVLAEQYLSGLRGERER